MATALAGRSAAAPAAGGWLANLVAGGQGAFYAATGVWPLAHIDSFQAVTGPKVDLWLVYTVGAVVAAVGLGLAAAAANRRVTPEVGYIAAGVAAALLGVDLVFVARGVVSQVYLLDAAAEGLLLVGWAVAAGRWGAGR